MKRSTAKKIVGFVAGYGGGLVTSSVISANVAPTKIHHRIGVWVGTAALSGIAGSAAAHYAGEMVDDVYDALKLP